jgi:hypothetical protein
LERLTGGLLRGLAGLFDEDPAPARGPMTDLVETASQLQAPPALATGLAVLAEIAVRVDGDDGAASDLLDQLPDPPPGGLAGALILRTRSVMALPGAHSALAEAAARLAAPGILSGAGQAPQAPPADGTGA